MIRKCSIYFPKSSFIFSSDFVLFSLVFSSYFFNYLSFSRILSFIFVLSLVIFHFLFLFACVLFHLHSLLFPLALSHFIQFASLSTNLHCVPNIKTPKELYLLYFSHQVLEWCNWRLLNIFASIALKLDIKRTHTCT